MNKLETNIVISMTYMIYFTFQEGSMDSLYEPVKENQELQEDICTSSRANTPVSALVKADGQKGFILS